MNPRPEARWATAVPEGVGVPAGGAQTDRAHPGGARPPGRRQSGSLASNDFTYYFTFFSKFFSSFPHGTCSLSVSCQYSALDGVYHQFWAAFPSNPTHRKHIVNRALYRIRDCHPLRCAVPSNLSIAQPS